MNKAQKIQGIDFIRIFSIMGIVIYHYVCHAPALQPYMLTFANNDYGVTFSHMFLIVSGFCLYYKYSDGQLNVVKFWKKDGSPFSLSFILPISSYLFFKQSSMVIGLEVFL